MEWLIENNLFIPMKLSKSDFFFKVSSLLQSNWGLSIYMRGSLLENPNPHPKSDIDLFIIYKDHENLKDKITDITTRLSSLGRPIDLHILSKKQLEEDIPQKLLFHTRPIFVVGDKITVYPIKADRNTIIQHWQKYNPSYPPDIMHSSVKSRVSALKNLTRCFGLISLIEKKMFTRDIQECLDYTETFDKTIHQYLLDNWNLVDYQKPMYLSKIKEFLMRYHHEYLIKTSP